MRRAFIALAVVPIGFAIWHYSPSSYAPVVRQYAPYAPNVEPVHALNPDATFARKPALKRNGIPFNPTPTMKADLKVTEVTGLRASVGVTDVEQAKIDGALELLMAYELDQASFEEEIRLALGQERGEKYIANAIKVGQQIAREIHPNMETDQ